MVDKDSTQSTWERPCGGRNYAQRNFFRWLDKLEKNIYESTRDALGADRTLTPGGEGSIPLPAANKEDMLDC